MIQDFFLTFKELSRIEIPNTYVKIDLTLLKNIQCPVGVTVLPSENSSNKRAVSRRTVDVEGNSAGQSTVVVTITVATGQG